MNDSGLVRLRRLSTDEIVGTEGKTGPVSYTHLVQASVEILSPVPVSGKCSEKDYESLFIRDPEVDRKSVV